MDILASMLAYLAGIGALFTGLAVLFFVFFSTPHEPLQTQQSASAMLVRPSTPNKPAAVEARAKQSADHFEKHTTAAGSPGGAQARDVHGKYAASAAQARRLQEERGRRWAYQQDSSFERRFLGYAD